MVVTRLDHDGNIRPWILAAQRVGATVRWLDFDPATGELELDQLETILTERTRLVAVTGASNLLGTIPDHRAIADRVHAVGALLWVDAVHLAAHVRIDRAALGADVLVCSPYKFCGPHLGVLAAGPDLLQTWQPDKLMPSTDAVPERFELGTLPYELLAGTTAAVDYLAGLGDGVSRTAELDSGLRSAESPRARTAGATRAGVARAWARRSTPGLPIAPRPSCSTSRDVRPATSLASSPPQEWQHRPATSTRIEASRHLGLGDRGAVRAGLAPYSDTVDVDRLLDAL